MTDQSGGGHDRDDLRQAYQRFGGLVYRRARRLLGDDQLARDVCQDVFVRILSSAAPWAPPSPVGWLYATTTHCCLNLLRSSRRSRAALRRLPRQDVSSPPTPVTLLLRRVPERLQEIAIYVGVDQMSQDEIAVVLGVSQKTVSNRIRELRELLNASDDAAAEAR